MLSSIGSATSLLDWSLAAGAGRASAQTSSSGLTEEEEREVEELKKTDQEVRRHEQQHIAAGGGLAGGASFTYVTGPDGKRYAVAGEVRIDTSEGRTPEETLQRARRIRAAALAPGEPSAQDYSVAAAASRMEMQALLEIARQSAEAAAADSESESAQTETDSAIAPARWQSADRAYRQAIAFGQPENAEAAGFSAFA
ncbi:MAG: hypothetical protein LBS70_08645 [Candidatus Accumulibacter sp.]|nr:hypothetical protein [Accumulibacter sp.]